MARGRGRVSPVSMWQQEALIAVAGITWQLFMHNNFVS